MKLRNKKTGEIGEGVKSVLDDKKLEVVTKDKIYTYDSLAELNEEWEDCEDKDYYFIDSYASGDERIIEDTDNRWSGDLAREEIGNYFKTREEAKKAVEKLKAWKRLKDKGIKVIDRGWEKINNINREDDGVIYIKVLLDTETYDCSWDDDLDLLFGGKE